ncbi:hypothetical protein TNIN_146911 [Trichonephila inaurata madagascariensis]|uniref:Uncharacterized protein n=1 Tax=Trichonephila inaurata madagascariensis TaxID=2747483 RepID=A0A8X6XDV2_9ARAC|nr:hypothetical protein TNIN_146911 [Trichonephila inaurata madagascariensis]
MNGLSTYAMKAKLDQLLELADTHNAQIIAIQKTKLKDQMKLNIKEFHINHLDRPNRRGGGLALLIRDGLLARLFLRFRQQPMYQVFSLETSMLSIPPGDVLQITVEAVTSLMQLTTELSSSSMMAPLAADALDIASADVFPFCRWAT